MSKDQINLQTKATAIMTSEDVLICLGPDAILADVEMIMDSNHINHLPVTESGKAGDSELIGIVDRPRLDQNKTASINNATLSVRELMIPIHKGLLVNEKHRITYRVLTEEDDLLLAAKFLYEKTHIPEEDYEFRVTALPVINSSDLHLKGILSYKDLIRDRKGMSGLLNSKSGFMQRKVSGLMTDIQRENEIFALVASQSHALTTAYDWIVNQGFRTIPVVENKDSRKLVGLITAHNVLKHEYHVVSALGWTANDDRLMIDADYLNLVLPTSSIEDTIPFFLQKPFYTSLLVVNDLEERIIVGILSYVDILDHFLSDK